MNIKHFTSSYVAAFSTLAICATPAHAAPGDPVRGGAELHRSHRVGDRGELHLLDRVDQRERVESSNRIVT